MHVLIKTYKRQRYPPYIGKRARIFKFSGSVIVLSVVVITLKLF